MYADHRDGNVIAQRGGSGHWPTEHDDRGRGAGRRHMVSRAPGTQLWRRESGGKTWREFTIGERKVYIYTLAGQFHVKILAAIVIVEIEI